MNQNISKNKRPPFGLPSELLNNTQTICTGLPRPGQIFAPINWNGYVSAYSAFVNTLGKQNSSYDRIVSRHDLKLISTNVINNKASAEELFLASQIWGWGNSGRGMSYTKKCMESEGLAKILKQVFLLVRQGDIKNAYISMKVEGCGATYVSKFLYFSALGSCISPLPVILDTRVMNSLIKTGAHEGWLAKEFADFSINDQGDIFLRKNATKYITYIEQMDLWAKALLCPADYIEYYFWSIG
jgi:hypothetical protein